MFTTASRCHSFRRARSLFSQFKVFIHSHSSPPANPSFSTKAPDPNSSSSSKTQLSASKYILSNNWINQSSLTSNSFCFDQSTVIETLSSFADDWKKAFEFFNWVETECDFVHTTESYNRMINILGKFFEFDLAWNLIEKMQKFTHSMPDHITFRTMFMRYASAHLVQEAIDTYNRTEQFNLKDQISFSNLIDALCECKHVPEAERLCFGDYKYSHGISYSDSSTKIYNMILRGWLKIGWWRRCRDFWKEMDKKGAIKDIHSYSVYMDIQCKSGKPWNAVKLYKEIQKKGIQLDVVAYNTVIRAIGIMDGVDVAIRLYREMIELGCKPSIVTYNTIMKLFCEYGRFTDAYKLLDQMSTSTSEPNAITYHCFFRYLERPKEILALFNRMIESGVRPRMDTYVMLMRKFGKCGFLRPIFIVWKTMEEHGLSPDECAYIALIDALVQKGMIDMARKYDEEMLAKGLSAKPRVKLGTKLMNE